MFHEDLKLVLETCNLTIHILSVLKILPSKLANIIRLGLHIISYALSLIN